MLVTGENRISQTEA